MVFDTNILIAYLNCEASVIEAMSRWKQEGRALFVSSISSAEVFSLATLSLSDMHVARAFLKEFISIPFDDTLAERTAFFRRAYGLTLPDAAIAASAFIRNVPLVTRDKQFKKLKEIIVLEM